MQKHQKRTNKNNFFQRQMKNQEEGFFLKKYDTDKLKKKNRKISISVNLMKKYDSVTLCRESFS